MPLWLIVKDILARMHIYVGKDKSYRPAPLISKSKQLRRLRAEVDFLIAETRRLNEELRLSKFGGEAQALIAQTKASFNYQWDAIPHGQYLPDDPAFLAGVNDTICTYTDMPANWFAGKHVADVGCGMGRFTYGLLALGASVTAMDQSSAALAQVQTLCAENADHLTLTFVDLLNWQDNGSRYDLVYCYGVVHHTGNTYQALYNVASMVKPGGRLFLMIYGYPETEKVFRAQAYYLNYRNRLRNLTFEDKVQILRKELPEEKVHGMFDAVSPKINDLLSYEEIAEFLQNMGFVNIHKTLESSNHHVAADRLSVNP